ncbi:phosphonate metabolism protein/1,5-bisphosphokinase (PRPP-forming) PhnN [Rhizobium sp.]
METNSPRRGVMIAVVGPSGAGKDSLLNLARAHYSDDNEVVFVQRVITRPADGATEDHVPVTPEEFERREQEGRFAVSWGAHGLRYGIPSETLDALAAGRILLANGSRAALSRFRAAYDDLAVLEITARPDVIASRLAGRGRETATEIEKRLARDTGNWQPDCRHIRIDNSGSLEDAANGLLAAIEALRSREPQP